MRLVSQASVVSSNVPGPTSELELPAALCRPPAPRGEGAPGLGTAPDRVRLVGARFYAFGHSPLYCGLLSYAGQVALSCTSDPAAEPCPARLASLFATALAELHTAAAHGPRPAARAPPALADRLAVVGLCVAAVAAVALALRLSLPSGRVNAQVESGLAL